MKRKATRGTLHKTLSGAYFGLHDEEDGVVLEEERKEEKRRRVEEGVGEEGSEEGVIELSAISPQDALPTKKKVDMAILEKKKKELIGALE